MGGSSKRKPRTGVTPRIQAGLRAYLTPPGPVSPLEAYSKMATPQPAPCGTTEGLQSPILSDAPAELQRSPVPPDSKDRSPKTPVN